MRRNKFELCNHQNLSFRFTSFVPFWRTPKCAGRMTANWQMKETGVKTKERVIFTTVDKIMVTDKKNPKGSYVTLN